LAIAILLDERLELIMGQLLILLDAEVITASGVNLKWTLENTISELIKKSNKKNYYWFLINDYIKARIFHGNLKKLNELEKFQRNNLMES
jgi:hypothetical protein